ncbi:hypothetical protein IFM89_021003 [Coptis chinensis]|uniref:Polygalacturonase n=1 Tax=Coptis chinensis TaxID=261450 RepID=A0A835H7Q3_9MAGN|nr:hypothetical protein IFM89_021003 [Coptis chinensis]
MRTPLIQHYALFFSIFTSFQSNPATSLNLHSTTFSVTDYRAIGDGTTYDTSHIQAAIDACSAAGGGNVIFPAGKDYLTATIYLKSGVTLEIEKGARILGGPRLVDYPVESKRWYVVLAENVTDVGIIGDGVIDGQGLKFVEKLDEKKNVMVSWNSSGACYGDECRPRLVGLHIVRCDNTLIDKVSIYGDFNTPNNDGIDIEDSNNTVITRCIIDTGDDAICPKTYTGPLYNLTAKDCWIRTKSSAIKLGSATWYDFKGLVFDNITIVDSHRGLAFQLRDGGNATDVTFSNINVSTRYYDPSWWGRAEPIYVTTCRRHSNSNAGSISNILFVNITSDSENGVFLSGCKGGLLSNLKFINVNFNYRRWTHFADGMVDYRPGCRGLVNHSMAGIVMENIEGLEVKNVNMKWSDKQLKGWNNPLDFNPSTVNNISLLSFHSGIYA